MATRKQPVGAHGSSDIDTSVDRQYTIKEYLQYPLKECQVVCNCQRPIGSAYITFYMLYNKKKNDIIAANPQLSKSFSTVENRDILMGEILDDLKLFSICCRTKILGHCP